ncbi:MAG: hypothetical protein WA954_05860 [Parerythrobacter sp.]
MRLLLAAAAPLAILGLAAPAHADHHAEMAAVSPDAFATVLADARRDEDRARDEFRNPAETLAFFGVQPGQTVAEYAPGGGWYTRVIAPYVGTTGKYVGLNFGPGGMVPAGMTDRLNAFPDTFGPQVVEQTGIPAENVSAFITTQAGEATDGTVDRVLIVRMMHNLMRWGIADTELMAMRRMLKDDGMVGIVQHMAPEGMPFDMTNGSKGYLKKSDVIKTMELAGFELAAESFVNANPRDTADYEGGVWTLPPRLSQGDTDRARYEAIGESNRMTLLFKKAK